ncbi:hypothetical protein PL11_001095 [Lentilactobacillus curieae]|uniref:dTDP-glucose 4,6-dehydratase n=2 Tax=Lentilactobacillus curieae TaxID=1138822 RepID=A0A1S6QG70_9LACO|nr:hypothetical protein PL11_001095 [Lentilactobacillus curieae]
MNIMVTGGAGFIGSHFCNLILNSYPADKILVVDKGTYAADFNFLRNLSLQFPNRLFIRKADINQSDLIAEWVDVFKIDTIVNFAAESHVDNSIADVEPFLMSNVNGTVRLLEVARQKGISRFIQISTDEVYGDSHLNGKHFSEDSPLRPSSPYAASKAAADMMVLANHRTYGQDVCITRSANNYGTRQYPEKLIPKIIKRAVADQLVPIYGVGNNCRSWLSVEDNCRAIDLVLRKGQSGKVYNVPGNQSVSNLELVTQILKRLNKPASLIKHVADRPGHDLNYLITGQPIELMGWQASHNIMSDLSDLVDWYTGNYSWLEQRKVGKQ